MDIGLWVVRENWESGYRRSKCVFQVGKIFWKEGQNLRYVFKTCESHPEVKLKVARARRLQEGQEL